jgi:hypothetical protein
MLKTANVATQIHSDRHLHRLPPSNQHLRDDNFSIVMQTAKKHRITRIICTALHEQHEVSSIAFVQANLTSPLQIGLPQHRQK